MKNATLTKNAQSRVIQTSSRDKVLVLLILHPDGPSPLHQGELAPGTRASTSFRPGSAGRAGLGSPPSPPTPGPRR